MPRRTIHRWATNANWQPETDKTKKIRRKPMFVKTQFNTIVNLAHYSKIYIDYSVKSPNSDNVYHEISVSLEDNVDGHMKNVREKTLALIPEKLPNSGDFAKAAFDDLFEAILNNEAAFDISNYYIQKMANNDKTIKEIDEVIDEDYATMISKQKSE